MLHPLRAAVRTAARTLGVGATLALALAPARPVRAQRPDSAGRVLAAESLTTAQIAALDRAHTVVLLVGGILEEHGPYLPSSADLVTNVDMADRLSARIAAGRARDGQPWTVLRVPVIPLGAHPFDWSVGRAGFPGSLPVRASTLRAVFMDLGDDLGALGFRRVVVVHGHGEPVHNRVLDEAGDYFRDTWGGRDGRGAFMVHLLGRVGCQSDLDAPDPPDSLLSSAARAENVASPHADAIETSHLLLLRPDLVDPAYRTAPTVGAADPDAWRLAARDRAWPGYVGAPRQATAALGRWTWERTVAACGAMLDRLLAGADERTMPRYADRMLAIPPVRTVVGIADREEARRAARQAAWLRGRGAKRAATGAR